MKLLRQNWGGEYKIVSVAQNGRRHVVLSRSSPKVLDDAEEQLLRALARRLGFKLVRAVEWDYQLMVSAAAHKALTELRKEKTP